MPNKLNYPSNPPSEQFAGYKSLLSALLNEAVNALDDSGQNMLIQAAQNNSIGNIKTLLKFDAKLNVIDKNGNTALSYAAKNLNVAACEMLISAGADCMVAIGHAGLSTDAAMLDTLKQAGVNLKMVDSAFKKHVNVIKDVSHIPSKSSPWLVNKSDDKIFHIKVCEIAKIFDITDDGVTMLMGAVYSNDGNLVNAYIRAGSNVNAVDNNGWTSLVRAAYYGNEKIVKSLIAAKADVNISTRSGQTALHKAVLGGGVGTIKALIDAGADLNTVDVKNNTPLKSAAVNGQYDIVKMLVENGADSLSAVAGASVASALDYFLNININKMYDFLRCAGITLQYLAAEFTDKVELLDYLIHRLNAKLKNPFPYGDSSVLLPAIKENNPIALEEFILAIGEINTKNYQEHTTALMDAVVSNNYLLASMLIEAGAETETFDYYGRTALAHAARNGNEHITKLLIEKGAVIENALGFAFNNSEFIVIDTLVRAGGFSETHAEKIKANFTKIVGENDKLNGSIDGDKIILNMIAKAAYEKGPEEFTNWMATINQVNVSGSEKNTELSTVINNDKNKTTLTATGNKELFNEDRFRGAASLHPIIEDGDGSEDGDETPDRDLHLDNNAKHMPFTQSGAVEDADVSVDDATAGLTGVPGINGPGMDQ